MANFFEIRVAPWGVRAGLLCAMAIGLAMSIGCADEKPVSVAQSAQGGDFCLFHPNIDERAQWDRLAQSEAGRGFIKDAESLLAEPDGLSDTDRWNLYLNYSRIGDRESYQKPFFRRQRRLEAFSFAECLENKGRFIAPLESVIRDICAERTWVIPAHDPKLDNFNGRRVDIDLYSSRRGADLAIVGAIMGQRLSPGLGELIKDSVEARVTTPFRNMLSGKQPRGWLNQKYNWNAVCLANVVAAGLYSAKTQEERDFFVNEACKEIKTYLSGFPKDGCCLEGVGYWTYGFSNYVWLSELVRRSTGGRIDPLLWPEAERPALFPFRSEIVSGVYPSFADCPQGVVPKPCLMGVISKRFGLGRSDYEALAETPMHGPGNYVFCFSGFGASLPPPPSKRREVDSGMRTWFPDAGILICRGRDGVAGDFGAAFKGGVNDGPHHHLDVGSYSVVCGGVPVICDPGKEIYTRRSFSSDRYQSNVNNSYGHPVPVVDGKQQRKAKDTAAVLLSSSFTPDLDVVVFDIKAAYDVPKLRRLDRTFRFHRDINCVEIEDSFEFDSPGSFENALISFGDFEKLSDGRLRVFWKDRSAIVEIISDCGAVSIGSERIQEDLENKVKPLRVALRLDAPMLKGCVKLKISPGR